MTLENRQVSFSLCFALLTLFGGGGDQLLPFPEEGRGDMAVASLASTPDRAERVSFTAAVASHISELVVTGPSSPEIKTVDDLSGKRVFVRPKSSYCESLQKLNRSFRGRGLDEVEITAASEYLRYIVDHYFDDPKIDDVNRTLFAFASDNARPKRIRRLRAKAAESGCDPNLWFRKVEVIVANEIGREPERYVSNIFKYCTVCSLLIDQEEIRRRLMAEAEAEKR
jgi:membrane-bound lytic murein transglycosylase MltF